jgi:hypothetical protein
MKVEQYRITLSLALDEHPLRHAVDVEVSLFRDTACERLATVIEKRFRPARTHE